MTLVVVGAIRPDEVRRAVVERVFAGPPAQRLSPRDASVPRPAGREPRKR